jgi:acyl-[acyl-carrier-protein] desaturase
MTQLQQGYDRDSIDTLRGLAYVAFQELATRISHKNTGRYSQDPVADRIMSRIAADENLHMVFYRDILGAALKIQPSRAVQAIVAEVLAFECPATGSRASCGRPQPSRRPASTTSGSTATRS